jgi:hypothetical protein
VYRTPASRPRTEERDERDSDLLWVGAFVWLGSLAHVLSCVMRAEPWGAGVTVTAALVVLIPWLLLETLRERIKKT